MKKILIAAAAALLLAAPAAAQVEGISMGAAPGATPTALSATSIALNGCTIGTDKRCMIGSVAFGGNMVAATASGPQIQNSAASSTVPTLIPNKSSTTTGFGAQASGNISAIVAGAEVGRWTSTGLNNTAIGATTAAAGKFTTVTATPYIAITNVGDFNYQLQITQSAAAAGNYYFASFTGGTGGSIINNGTTTTYATTSDERLKNWQHARQHDYRAKIAQLWVGDYLWKKDGAPGFGVRAQQAYATLGRPFGVTPPRNPRDRWVAPAEPFAFLALWGVKDLYKRVDAQQKEIDTLKRQVRILQRQAAR